MLVRELFVAKSKRSEVTMASCTKKKKKKKFRQAVQRNMAASSPHINPWSMIPCQSALLYLEYSFVP